MSDNFIEESTQGWFSRIGDAIKGILFGLLLFVLAFPLLFWNEGRAVERIKTLDEGSGAVVSIGAEQVLSENQQKLVHLSAMATTTETLEDPVFGVSENSLKLRRRVQMYQWQEEVTTRKEKQMGGSEKTIKEYRYDKVWKNGLIHSSEFRKEGYQNPSSMAYSAKQQQANRITAGAFVLPGSLVAKINNPETLNLDATAPIPPALQNAQHYDGGFYIGNEPSAPVVGDLRITFEVVRPTLVSLVAQQWGDSFQPYITEAGGDINLLQLGSVGASAMFQQAQDDNSILTWILRVVGLAMMAFGLGLILRPLSVFADVVPLFGTIVGAGTGIIAFFIAVTFSLLTIAFAWLFFRPLLAVGLIAIALAAAWLVRSRMKQVSQEDVVAEGNELQPS